MSQMQQRFDQMGENMNSRASIIDHAIETLPVKMMSFEEICPQWNFALTAGISTNPYLDIKEGKNCIVGEAHGFRNSAYICSKCWEYSQSFVSSVLGNRNSGYIITDNGLFESVKNDFVQHFNQKHAYRGSIMAKIRRHACKLIQGLRLKLPHLPAYPSNISVLSFDWAKSYLRINWLMVSRLLFVPKKWIYGGDGDSTYKHQISSSINYILNDFSKDIYKYFPRNLSVWIMLLAGTCLPGKIITDAPIAQLFPTTAPKWSVPVLTNISPIRFLPIRYFTFCHQAFAAPEYPPNQNVLIDNAVGNLHFGVESYHFLHNTTFRLHNENRCSLAKNAIQLDNCDSQYACCWLEE